MEKVYVLDTNMLVVNPNVIDDLGRHTVVVPFWVLEELDHLKQSKAELAFAVREVSRILEAYRLKGLKDGRFLVDGIQTDSGGTLIFDHNASDLTQLGFTVEDTVDSRVLLVAKHWQEQEKKSSASKGSAPRKVILLSQDVFLRIKASSAGILAEDWKKDTLVSRVEDIYTGASIFPIQPHSEALLPEFFKSGSLPIADLGDSYDFSGVMPNQCLTLTWRDGKTALGIYKKAEGLIVHVKKALPKGTRQNSGIQPINDEQALAYELLMDPTIDLVSLTGVAGTGKTLMALLVAYEQFKAGNYKEIRVWRPTQIVGESLGFYPGDINEKFGPFAAPVYRAFAKILASFSDGAPNYENGIITLPGFSVDPILHVKGSTVDDTFLIVDESQDLTPHVMRALMTRVGHNTKLVLTGDVLQVENRFLNSLFNGLTYAVEAWRCEVESAHVELLKSERSAFVQKAVRLMT